MNNPTEDKFQNSIAKAGMTVTEKCSEVLLVYTI